MEKNWISSTQRLILIFIPGLLFFASYSNAQQMIGKTWFEPTLIKNASNVCPEFLNQVKRAFIYGEEYPGALENVGEVLSRGYYSEATAIQVLLNNKPVYIRFALAHGCGGACEGEQVVTSTKPIENDKIYTTDFDEQELNGMPTVVVNGHSRFIRAEDQNYYLASVNDLIEIHQLNADASWTRACEISIEPTEQNYALSPAATAMREAVSGLKKSLEPIMGSYGNCGSSRAGLRRLSLLDKNLDTVSYRPWQLEKQNRYTEGAFEYLEKWSIQGVPQNTSYKLFKLELEQTISAAKNFYAQQYALDIKSAEHLAESAIRNAVGIAINPAFPPQPEERKKILKVLLEKGDISVIKSVSADIASLDLTENGGDTLVAASINYPEALEYLLQQGLSPNTPNAFGKTPLMYAAQYNQLRSVEILLTGGADANSQTIIPNDDCSFTLRKSGMTALHYAARYASKEVIEKLVQHGANSLVTTSEKSGGYPFDWLIKYTDPNAEEKNKNISGKDLIATKKLLSLPSEKEVIAIIKKLNSNAEKLYADGKIEEAYHSVKKASQLSPMDNRTLSNMSLIAHKFGKTEIALEATKHLIENGKDQKMVANAWYNYGLICDSATFTFYNGNSYCQYSKWHNYFSAYRAHPTDAREQKLNSILQSDLRSCVFKAAKVFVFSGCGQYESSTQLCILHPKEMIVDTSEFTWTVKKPISMKRNLTVTKEETVFLGKPLTSYPIGEKILSVYKPTDRLELPLKWDNELCKEDYSVITQ